MNHIIFRKGTNDEAIWNDSTVNNIYKLPEQLPLNSIIIDIGCHIGSYSYEAAKRGASKIYAFEACQESFELASHNLAPFIKKGIVELYHYAVWDKDREILILNTGGINEPNMGGNSVFTEWWSGETNERVETIKLDTIFSICTNHEKVEYIKFDCEGSEYKIFQGSQLFDKYAKKLIGECHEGSAIGNTHGLADFFKNKGYTIINEISNPAINLGWIEAEKYD